MFVDVDDWRWPRWVAGRRGRRCAAGAAAARLPRRAVLCGRSAVASARCTWRPKRRSWPSRTARPGTATRTCRWTCCCRRTTRTPARALIDDTASPSLRPGDARRPRAAAPGDPRTRCRAFAREGGATGEPTVGPAGQTRGDTVHLDVVDARGQPGVAHAVRRLAAVDRRRSRRWASAWIARPDVLAGGGPAELPGARASARASRCRRRWPCATASRRWRSAPPAATSRTSGSCASGWPTCTAA